MVGNRTNDVKVYCSFCGKSQDEVKKIILYHHERLDGSGFPLRLKEAEIPLSCQIVAVCDAFDEMICGIAQRRSRVYEAVEYLKSFKNVIKIKKDFLLINHKKTAQNFGRLLLITFPG